MSFAAFFRSSDARERLRLLPDQMAAGPGHIPSLDGLRAVSILIVMMSHFVNRNLFPGGLGVYIFFVISGFLITRLLFAERKLTGGVSLPRFYLRRALRLYPVVLVYTVIVVFALTCLGLLRNPLEPVSALLYFANYLHRDIHAWTSPFEIFWSLSVEEHFYLLLPATLLLSRTPGRLLWIVIAVCVGCLALRVGVAARHPEWIPTATFYMRTEYRLDSLAFGVVIACLCESARGREWLLRLAHPLYLGLALLVILFALVFRDPFFRETLRYSCLGAAISLIVVFVVFRGGWIAAVLNSRPLVTLGVLSYSLYVWHFVVHTSLKMAFPAMTKLVEAPLGMGLSLLLAFVSYYGLEKPALRLRAKLQAPRRSPAQPAMVEGSASLS